MKNTDVETYSPILKGPAQRPVGQETMREDIRDALKCAACIVAAFVLGTGLGLVYLSGF